MNATSVIDALNNAAEQANEITDGYLNHGGCCVYAAMVGAELERLGLSVRIVVGYDGRTSLDTVRQDVIDAGDNPKYPRHWNRHGLYFHHVGVSFVMDGTRYLYDSEDGLREWPEGRPADLMAWPVNPGGLSVKEAKALASTPVGWNRMFDRANIPALRRMVRRQFREVTNANA